MTLQRNGESIILHILVHPKASEDRVVGFHGETLKVKVTAPPTGGKANQGLIKVLAKRLNIAQSHIEIIQGRTSRRKVLRIRNIRPDEVIHALKRLS